MNQRRDLEALEMMFQNKSPSIFPFNELGSSEFQGTFHTNMSSALRCMGREDEAAVYLSNWLRLHGGTRPNFFGWTSGSWYLYGKLGIPGSTVACVPKARDILAEALRLQQAD